MKKRAFTLIELLIATLIFSVLIACIYSVFHTGTLYYRNAETSFAEFQTARLAINRIELDLKNSFAYNSGEAIFKGSENSIEFFTVQAIFDKSGKTLPGIAKVIYETSDQEFLCRRLSGSEILNPSAVGEKQEISSLIKEVNFEFAYLTGVPGKPYDWQKEPWPKNDLQKKQLPLAVMVTIKFVSGKEFKKIISLPLAVGNP